MTAERKFHGSLDGDEGQRGAAGFEDVDQGWDDGFLVDVKVDEMGRNFLGGVVASLIVWRGSGCVERSGHEVSIGGGVHG